MKRAQNNKLFPAFLFGLSSTAGVITLVSNLMFLLPSSAAPMGQSKGQQPQPILTKAAGAVFSSTGKPVLAAGLPVGVLGVVGVGLLVAQRRRNRAPLQFLQNGDARSWNFWRLQHPNQKLSLGNLNLAGKKLRLFNLSRADLKGADLRGADLTEAQCSYAKLQGAKLQGATLVNANLNYVDLEEADLEGAVLDYSSVNYANLHRANLTCASFRAGQLVGSRLTEVFATGTNFLWARMRSTVLRHANFSKANLSQADLSNATISDCNLATADLHQVNLSGAEVQDSSLPDPEV